MRWVQELVHQNRYILYLVDNSDGTIKTNGYYAEIAMDKSPLQRARWNMDIKFLETSADARYADGEVIKEKAGQAFTLTRIKEIAERHLKKYAKRYPLTYQLGDESEQVDGV